MFLHHAVSPRLICAALLATAACGSADRTAIAKGPAVVDDFGDTVRFDSSARRIVSLNPTTTEILFAIGVGSRVIGRTKWDSWPDSAKLVPELGDGLRPNVEAVLTVHPDLVILYASSDNETAARQLREAGVRTVAIRIDSIAEFARATHLLGRLVGETARAASVVDSVQRTLDRVRAATATLPKTSVFYHTWDKPIITIGAHSFLNELVIIAGGRNIYGDVKAISPIVTLEDIVSRNPDVLLVGPPTDQKLFKSASWRVVPAVKARRVFVYDTNVVGRPSVTLGMAAVNLANLLHPGVIR